jgi:hypothetical protein
VERGRSECRAALGRRVLIAAMVVYMGEEVVTVVLNLFQIGVISSSARLIDISALT